MEHSSQHLLLTPFITRFVYPCKVTLCLHFLMKSTSYYTKEGILQKCVFCVVFCVFTIFDALQLKDFETYKEYTINKASLFLSTSEKSSQIPF